MYLGMLASKKLDLTSKKKKRARVFACVESTDRIFANSFKS